MERFNSWICAQITNRRHPESRVLESYRLFELAFFMQLSGKLPQCVTTDLADVHVAEPSEQTSSSIGYHTCLNKEQLSQLKLYYASKVPVNADHQASSSYFDLHEHPSDSITSYPIFFNRDKHGRKVKYSTANADDFTSSFASSYIALLPQSCAGVSTLCGQIQTIFKHQFNQKEYLLAYVHWFKEIERDIESGLHTVVLNSSASFCRVVRLSDLSRPIIHAIDCDDPNKLWLIVFKVL